MKVKHYNFMMLAGGYHGGCIHLENEDGDIVVVESSSKGKKALCHEAARRLRRVADQLDKMAEQTIEKRKA